MCSFHVGVCKRMKGDGVKRVGCCCVNIVSREMEREEDRARCCLGEGEGEERMQHPCCCCVDVVSREMKRGERAHCWLHQGRGRGRRLGCCCCCCAEGEGKGWVITVVIAERKGGESTHSCCCCSFDAVMCGGKVGKVCHCHHVSG